MCGCMFNVRMAFVSNGKNGKNVVTCFFCAQSNPSVKCCHSTRCDSDTVVVEASRTLSAYSAILGKSIYCIPTVFFLFVLDFFSYFLSLFVFLSFFPFYLALSLPLSHSLSALLLVVYVLWPLLAFSNSYAPLPLSHSSFGLVRFLFIIVSYTYVKFIAYFSGIFYP